MALATLDSGGATVARAAAAQLDEAGLRAELVHRLAGRHEGAPAIVWVRDGSETVLHLDSLAVALEPGLLRVSVDLETDEAPRATFDVTLALAVPDGPTDLFAVTDELPRGEPNVATRWGTTLQDAVWCALLAVADDHAGGRAEAIAAGRDALLVRGTATSHQPSGA